MLYISTHIGTLQAQACDFSKIVIQEKPGDFEGKQGHPLYTSTYKVCDPRPNQVRPGSILIRAGCLFPKTRNPVLMYGAIGLLTDDLGRQPHHHLPYLVLMDSMSDSWICLTKPVFTSMGFPLNDESTIPVGQDESRTNAGAVVSSHG